MPFENWFDQNFDRRIEPYEQTQDEHDARLTRVEGETPGVEPPEKDPVVVPVSGLCDPDSGNVITAIHDHYRERDPNDRNHHYVLDAREWTAETGCDEVFTQRGAEEFREETGRDPIWFDSHRYFGISGEGLVDIDVQSPDVDLLFSIGRREGGVPNAQRTVLENFRVDVSGDVDCGIAVVHTYIRGLIKDIELRGTRNRQHDEFGGSKYGVKPDAIHPRGQNEIRNVKQTSGDTRAPDATDIFPHAIPFSSERFHVGRNHWVGCSAHDFWNNGFYLKGGPGQNVIERSTAKNCAGAHIRLGANDVARDCQIEMGGRTELCGPGIWLNEGEPLVDHCTITVGEQWNADAIRINSDAAGGTVRDSRITNDADCRTVVISEQGSDVDERPTRLINLDIDHAGRSGGYAVENFRPGLEIVGGHWRGGSAREKRHLLVSNPRVRVSKTTFQTDDANLMIRGAESTFSDVEVRGGELYVRRDGPDGLRFDGRCSDVEINAPDEIVDLIRGTGGSSGSGNGSGWKSRTLSKGTPFETTAYRYDAGEGATGVVVGGQHGIEDSGWLAAEEIVEEYAPSQGTLVVISRMDPVAIDRSTYGNGEWNMNREWPPGQAPRYAPVRRRWEIITEVDPDVIIDLHSSGGVYGGSPSGVGQAIFPTGGSESIVDRVCNRLTTDVLGSKWDRDMSYRRGNTISGEDRLLIHKVEADLDARGFICEPTRANGTTLTERVLWNRKSAEFLLEECVGMEFRQK